MRPGRDSARRLVELLETQGFLPAPSSCDPARTGQQPLHGYAIAQRIHHSRIRFSVEEGSLYPALQKLLLKGWVKAAPAIRKRDARSGSID